MTRPAALTDHDWTDRAVEVIEQIVTTRGTVTSEDLRAEIEAPESANLIGNAFKSAYAKRIITPISYRPSRDKSRKGGAIRVWGPRNG